MKKLIKQLCMIMAVVLVFALFNCSIYFLMTRRLSNNFSGADRAQMIDVGSYLPFEEGSDLPDIKTDFRLESDLPVLDGAAALVPVYASIIDTVYPEGCVTYEGGTFSDDNYYGENFAPDSKMQYRNTVRGYTAVVDGDCDILSVPLPLKSKRNMLRKRALSLCTYPLDLRALCFLSIKTTPLTI